MIEFAYHSTPGKPEEHALVAVSTDTIASLEPSGDKCLVTLKTGREFLATTSYTHIRQIWIASRSRFASAHE